MVGLDTLPRIKEIHHELQDIESRQKNLLQELFALMGIKAETASRKTSPNRLTPEMARRLCGC